MPDDQAPRSSAYARMFLIRHLKSDYLAALIERSAEVSTRVFGNDRAHTEFRVATGHRHLIANQDDADVARALRTLPGADANIPMGSPGRTYTVTWDGVRAPV